MCAHDYCHFDLIYCRSIKQCVSHTQQIATSQISRDVVASVLMNRVILLYLVVSMGVFLASWFPRDFPSVGLHLISIISFRLWWCMLGGSFWI